MTLRELPPKTTPRILGIDSLSPASQVILDKATGALGTGVCFWGRYFTSKRTTGTGEYHRITEGAFLSERQIRVLPIARQTNHVSLDYDVGAKDGRDNAEDIEASFPGESGPVRLFLDVEGNGASHLSVDYYLGWCDGLKTTGLKLLPCVYGIPGDLVTWHAVASAMLRGAECHGVWLSHPYWGSEKTEPVEWSPAMLRPYPGIQGVDVLLWQYLFCGTYDRNMVNPALADASEFLSTLPLP